MTFSWTAKPGPYGHIDHHLECHDPEALGGLWIRTLTPWESNLGWGNTYPQANLTSVSSDLKSSISGPPGWYSCDKAKYICIHAMLRWCQLVLFFWGSKLWTTYFCPAQALEPFPNGSKYACINPSGSAFNHLSGSKFSGSGKTVGSICI